MGASGAMQSASPVYGGNLALNYEMEQGQRFFRAKLNGKLTFCREDYDTIIAAPFGTVFYLYMEKSTDPAGLTFAPYYKSKFTITDCTVNVDDRKITVQPQTTDQYDKVLAGMDNEYNLITLAPAMNGVNISKRPLVQVYEAGADFLNCYIAGTSWEQDCTANANKNELGHIYWFGLDTIFIKIEVVNAGAITGTYSGKLVRTGTHMEGGTVFEVYEVLLENDAGATDYFFNIIMDVRTAYYEDWWFGTIDLRRRVGDTSMSYASKTLSSETFNTGFYKLTGDAAVNVWVENVFIMARWLTDAEEVDGVTLYDLPSDDIGGENRNYHKVAPVQADCCVSTTNTSATPTEYGLVYDFREFNVSAFTGWMGADGMSSANWQNGTFLYVNVQAGDEVFIKAQTSSSSYYCFVTDAFTPTDSGQMFSICSGRQRVTVTYNTQTTDTAPADAKYLYIGRNTTSTNNYIPQVFTINGNAVDLTQYDTPQYFPINGDGLYYAEPTHAADEWFRPIAQSNWMNGTSYWFNYVTVFQYLETQGMVSYNLRNAYPLWSCLSVLLGATGSSVTFAGTSAHSEFLYSVSNPLSGETVKLFVTPKSNILAGDYTVPAQKAMTTLGQFLDMLRNVYQLYWYIDSDNRLRIEHISWYKNGGSYSGSPTVGIDLTTLLEKRNDTAWAYGVNEYTYEKEEMPQRYQFEWMDDERIPFKGEAIEILSPAVAEGKVESVSVGNFSSDIDYMLLNPSVFSQDGFALIGATGSGNTWSVPFVTYNRDGVTTTLQNGYLSFYYLQLTYWVYDLPAKSAKINGTVYSLAYVSRRKTQKVTIPLGGTDPDFLKLVKTNIGNGEIRAVSIPLSSRVAQVTLNYDTE